MADIKINTILSRKLKEQSPQNKHSVIISIIYSPSYCPNLYDFLFSGIMNIYIWKNAGKYTVLHDFQFMDKPKTMEWVPKLFYIYVNINQQQKMTEFKFWGVNYPFKNKHKP